MAATYTPVAITAQLETDEALGPLPWGWVQMDFPGGTGKHLFVNEKVRAITHIDPRTKGLRKHDIRDIEEGELPYGWEENWDEELGLFYVNHLMGQTYLEPPWDQTVRTHVVELMKQVEYRKAHVRDTIVAEETVVVEGEGEGEEEVIIEEHIVEVDDPNAEEQAQPQVQEEPAEEPVQEEEEEAEEELEEELEAEEEVEEELEEEYEQEEEYEGEASPEQEEVRRVKIQLEEETRQREELEDQVRHLKKEILGLINTEEAREIARSDEEMAAAAAVAVSSGSINKRETMAPLKTYNMDVELLTLKKKLELAKLESEALKMKTIRLKNEAAVFRSNSELVKSSENLVRDNSKTDGLYSTYVVPQWIKDINIVAENSKTVRVKIGQVAKKNPDAMSFKDKLLYFTANAVNENKQVVVPAPLTKQQSRVARGKETAYARNIEEDEEEEALEEEFA